MENEVVVFADLVALLAKSTGTTEALCDSFLRELLALGVEKLTSGNDFLVKGLGTFRQIGGFCQERGEKERRRGFDPEGLAPAAIKGGK